jgi:hypothetical protein
VRGASSMSRAFVLLFADRSGISVGCLCAQKQKDRYQYHVSTLGIHNSCGTDRTDAVTQEVLTKFWMEITCDIGVFLLISLLY